jgi:hypothetical protein
MLGTEEEWAKIGGKSFRSFDEYKIDEDGGETILTFFTGDKIFYRFKLNDIKKYKKRKFGKNSYVITLIRQQVK